ncbi:MAG TPA: tetratricopeptide repeat protein [Salinimicrobium sp.]|nr:tetratricopeptide repeat protein [Salinimicrobium sp.]
MSFIERFGLLVFIWALPILSFGQSPYRSTIDSLYKSFQKAKSISENDIENVRKEIYEFSDDGKHEVAKTAVFRFIELSEKQGNIKIRASLYFILGRIYRKSGNNTKGIEAFEESLNLYKEAEEEEILAQIYSQIGNIYYDMGQNDKAMEMQLKSLSLNQKYGNKNRMAYTLSGIGFIMGDQKRYREAIGYFKQSLDISKKLGDSTQIAANYTHLGITKHTLKEYDSSLYYLNKSLEYAEPIGFDYMIGYVSDYIGKVYTEQKDYTKAKGYLEKSLELRLKQNSPIDLAQTRLSLAWLYIYQKEPAPAIELAHQALIGSQGTHFLIGEKNANEALSKAYELNGDYQNALIHYKGFKNVNDSLINTEKSKSINEINTQIKVEQETYELKLKQSRQRMLYMSILILFIGAFSLLITRFIRYKKRQKKQADLKLKLKELEAEQEILFSTHSERKRISQDLHDDLGTTISAINLIITNSYLHDKSLVKMITKANMDLKYFFKKLSMPDLSGDGLFHILREKIDGLNAIGKVHFIFIGIGKESLMPTVLKLPITRISVELLSNVLKHSDASEATLQLLIDSEQVQLIVEDNGKGYNTKTEKKGMGINNIYSRADRWNGEVHISSSTAGTTSIITVPLINY